MTHIVWDWNGTLLNDFHAVVDAANLQIERLGGVGLDIESYRERFRRPVRGFNEEIIGRPLTDAEWDELDRAFHEKYFTAAVDCQLAEGAMDAIQRAADAGITQSLLSMAPHDHLTGLLPQFGLDATFARVDGNTGPGGVPKERNLRRHLNALELDAAEVFLIGDATDDAVAAKAVGARVILVEAGSCHTPAVLAQFAPVVATVGAAVDAIIAARDAAASVA